MRPGSDRFHHDWPRSRDFPARAVMGPGPSLKELFASISGSILNFDMLCSISALIYLFDDGSDNFALLL